MTAGADAGRSGGAAPLFAPGPEGSFHSPSARSSSPDLVAGGLWTPDPWLVGLLGAAELDREKYLAGSPATASATQAGAVFLLGGFVEVRSLSLLLHDPGENPCLFKTGRQRRNVRRHLLEGVVLGWQKCAECCEVGVGLAASASREMKLGALFM